MCCEVSAYPHVVLEAIGMVVEIMTNYPVAEKCEE